MADALTHGGVSRTRGSGRGERMVFITIDSLHAILADYTPHGDVPRRGRPVRLERNARTGLMALVVNGVPMATGSAMRLTVRGAGMSSLAIDVSRSDETDGVGPGERRLLFMPDDLLAMVRFVSGGTIPRDAELRGVAVNARLERMVALVVYANWDDFTFDGRATTPSQDFPFGIDLRYERGGHDDRVVVYDEKGTPVRRAVAPDVAKGVR